MTALAATSSGQDLSKESRYRGLMERYLGPEVVATFADDDVTEVYVNAGDGVLRADTHSRGKVSLGAAVRGDQVEQFLGTVAAYRGDTLGPMTPSVQAELPAETFGGARLQGFVPPLVPRAWRAAIFWRALSSIRRCRRDLPRSSPSHTDPRGESGCPFGVHPLDAIMSVRAKSHPPIPPTLISLLVRSRDLVVSGFPLTICLIQLPTTSTRRFWRRGS